MGSIPAGETIKNKTMNEQFDNNKLSQINENLTKIEKKLGSYWTALFKGLLYGLGTVIGAAMAIILIGWFLNIIGVIPALKKTSDQWRSAIQQVQENKSFVPSETTTTTTTTTPAQ